MKMKKTVIGLLSTCLALGVSETAIYASGDKVQVEDNLDTQVETFEPGTMESKVKGEEMNKEILEVEDISREIKVLEEGSLDENIEGKEMLTKEIIKE